jgi:hypothetical protein
MSSSGPGHEKPVSIALRQQGVEFTAAVENWPVSHPRPEHLSPGPVAFGKGTGKAPKGTRRSIDQEAATRKLFAVRVPPDTARKVQKDRPVSIDVLFSSDETASASLTIPPLSPERLIETGHAGLLANAFDESGQPEIAAPLRASLSVQPADGPDRFWIDRVVRAGTGLIINGWIANLPTRKIHLVTGDLQNWLLNSSFKLLRRPDVHAFLREQGAAASASDEHGFTVVLPDISETEQDLYFVEVIGDGSAVTFLGPVRTKVEPDEKLALELVHTAFGAIRSLDAETIDVSYRPVLSKPKGQMAAQRFEFGPPPQKGAPLASIIIPFYGDAFFLNCAHHLQRVLGDGFELVLVVDDERIWPEIYNGVVLRSSGFQLPTLLLRNLSNYGYGGANNIGAGLARGDVLFLMNSDVLVTDPRPLRTAAEAIRTRNLNRQDEVVIGFSLLYEDDTIQHIGMEFRRSAHIGDRFLADHPMKGLPFAFYDGPSIRSAPAVTGALMALSADLYRKLDGFDLHYERGDFEDGDLCLRARQAGAEIEVHVHPGLYHLERQSIPAMGDTDVRSMVTYMNCVEFNRRWEARLERPKRIFQVAGRPQAEPKPRAAIGTR